MKATVFNKPQTGNEITNVNGHRLHFRVEWENFSNAKYIIFYVPGYSGHVNRPELFKMTKTMNKNGAVVVAIDMQGHGYSEGERCLMIDHNHLIDDVMQVIDGFMNQNTSETVTFCKAEGSFSREQLPIVRKFPFFVMGSSMGGAISTMVGHRLYSKENRELFPTFHGAIMCAPALSFKMPNWLLVETLRYTVGTCAPTAQMPSALSNVTDNSLTFKHKESLEMTEADTWGNEGGLGWNQGMRWGTALMFIDFAAAIRKTMDTTMHPFLILHDPADEICGIDGSRALMEKSKTPDEMKQLIETPGYLHGILANEPEAASELCVPWMQQVVSSAIAKTNTNTGTTTPADRI